MAYARLEHSIMLISCNSTLDSFWKPAFLSQCIDVDGMKIIATICQTLDFVGLVGVGLRCKVPSVSIWVDPANLSARPKQTREIHD